MLFKNLFGSKKPTSADSPPDRHAPLLDKSNLLEQMKVAQKILSDGDRKNYPRAEAILLKCSEANIRGALTTLGFHYVQLSENAKIKQGYSMLVEAHQAGDCAASNKLGYVWAKGLLGSPNYEKAMEYYGVAANAGDREAAFNLGVMFLNGQGVNINFEKAREWFKTADLLGNKAAAGPLAYIDFAIKTFEQEAALARAMGRRYTPNLPNKSKAQSTYAELTKLIESDELVLQGLSTTAMGMGVSINAYSSVQHALTLMRNISFHTGIPYETILNRCVAEEIGEIEEYIEDMT